MKKETYKRIEKGEERKKSNKEIEEKKGRIIQKMRKNGKKVKGSLKQTRRKR